MSIGRRRLAQICSKGSNVYHDYHRLGLILFLTVTWLSSAELDSVPIATSGMEVLGASHLVVALVQCSVQDDLWVR